MQLLTKPTHAQLIANGRLQDPVRDTPAEIDFRPMVKLFTADAGLALVVQVRRKYSYCIIWKPILGLSLSLPHRESRYSFSS